MSKEIVINRDMEGLKTEVIELVRIDDESVRMIVEAMKGGSEASTFWLKVDTGGVEPKRFVVIVDGIGFGMMWKNLDLIIARIVERR